MRLVRTSQPYNDENFFGYLLRLSEINYLGGVPWLVKLAGLNTNASTNLSKTMVFGGDVDLHPLSNLSGVSTESLDAMRYHCAKSGKTVQIYSQPVSHHAIRLKEPKICPACLAESNHARMVWDLSMVTCCPFHGCLLIDHCPGCGNRINWNRKGVSTCKCNYDLRTITGRQATNDGGHITRLVHIKLGHNVDPPPLTTPLADLKLAELFTVVSFFSSYFANEKAAASGKLLGRNMTIAQLHKNMADVSTLFDKWPNNFIQFLQTTEFKPAKNAKFGLYHRFGSFYPPFKYLFLNDRFAFIRDAFEKYQLKYFSHGYVRHQNLQVIDAHEKDASVSRAEAAKQLQTSEKWVDRLIGAGTLEATKIKSGKRHLISIKRASVDRLGKRYKNLISLTSMKRILRIKSKTVHTLINNGILPCERGPSVDGFPHWRFYIPDVEELLSRIEAHILHPDLLAGPTDLITFSKARQMMSSHQFSTLEFFQMVISGMLKPCLRMDMLHIDSFLFEKQEINRGISKFDRKLRAKGYTMKTFKDLIGVSLDAAYKIEKTGLIKARYSGLPKVGKLIDKEAAEQFHRTYITSTEISKQCGVNANTVIKYLSRAGIRPISGPSVDGGPRYLYIRKDLMDFDFKCIIPSRRAKNLWPPNQMTIYDEAA